MTKVAQPPHKFFTSQDMDISKRDPTPRVSKRSLHPTRRFHPYITPTEIELLTEKLSRSTISIGPSLPSTSLLPTALQSNVAHTEGKRSPSIFSHVPPPPSTKPLKGILKKPTKQFPLFLEDTSNSVPRLKFETSSSLPQNVSCHGGRQRSTYSRKTHQPYSVWPRGPSSDLLCHHHYRPTLLYRNSRKISFPSPTATRDPRQRHSHPSRDIILPSVRHSSAPEEDVLLELGHVKTVPSYVYVDAETNSSHEIYSSTLDSLADVSISGSTGVGGRECPNTQKSNDDSDAYGLPDYEDDEETPSTVIIQRQGDDNAVPTDGEEEDNVEVVYVEENEDADEVGGIMDSEEASQLLYEIFCVSDSDDDDHDSELGAGPSQGPCQRSVAKGKGIDPRERGGRYTSFSDSDSDSKSESKDDYYTDEEAVLVQHLADQHSCTVVTEEDVDHFLQDTVETMCLSSTATTSLTATKSTSSNSYTSSSPSSDSLSLSSSLSSTSTSTHSLITPLVSPSPTHCALQFFESASALDAMSLPQVADNVDNKKIDIFDHIVSASLKIPERTSDSSPVATPVLVQTSIPLLLPSTFITSSEDIEMEETEEIEVTLDDEMDTTEDFPSGQTFCYPNTYSASILWELPNGSDTMDVDMDIPSW